MLEVKKGIVNRLGPLKWPLLILNFVILLILGWGNGCGEGLLRSHRGPFHSLSNDDNNPGNGENGDIVLVPGSRTISVLHSGQVLKNMQSLAGVEIPSGKTLEVFEKKKTSFSEDGRANSLNAPILLAISSLGGEVCNDLIVQENALDRAKRRIFPQIDFALNPEQQDAEGVKDSVRRMARSFWGRNESDEEMEIILSGLDEMVSYGTNQPGDTEMAMIYICTSMISSLEAYSL